MLFDELLERVHRRLIRYQQSSEADVVLGESALAEAGELWQSAQPVTPDHPTPDENQRLAVARHAMEWLHLFRYAALPTGPDNPELARAIIFFQPLADNPDMIPEALEVLVGPTADADTQADVAADLLNHAMNVTDAPLLDAGISLLAAAVAGTLEDNPERGRYLSELSLALRERYERSGVLDDLEQAVILGEQAVGVTPDGDPNRAGRLSNLGNRYRQRYQRTGVLDDLERAVEVGQRAVEAPSDDPSDRAMYLSNLGLAYQERYARSGVRDDLERAIALGEQAAAATTDGHSAPYLSNLGLAYQQRYQRTGVLDDLERAVEVGQRAVEAPSDDPSDRAMYLSNLGLAYQQRYQRTGVLDDLERAVEVGEQAVEAVPEPHLNREKYVVNLGLAYLERYVRSGVLDDLEQAIALGEQTVAAIPEDHPDRGRCLSNLGYVYQKRYERSGVLDDLTRAIARGTQSMAATAEDHPDRAMYLSNLGNAYQQRYQRSGVLDDLEQAITFGRQSVAVTPDDHPDRGRYLSNLGYVHQERYVRSGVLDDLEQAIALGEQAVAATPDDHLNRAKAVTNLGNSYLERYVRSGVLDDLEQAIALGEQAVAATPNDHPDRGKYLSNLGNAYLELYARTGMLDRLKQATETGEQAVAATAEDHPDRAMYLSNLGLAYQRRYQRSGALSDLDQAIKRGRQSVAAVPKERPDRGKYLSNLGIAYLERYARRGGVEDLEQAIASGKQSVAATPHDHPNRAAYLCGLGNAYQAKIDEDGLGIDPESLGTLARHVAGATTSSPADRVLAGRVVGSLAHTMNEHTTAVELLDAAVRLLPSVAPRESERADQEYRLSQHLGLVGEAVAAHCAISDPVGAVEVAELGRGILLSAHLDSRSDLTDLEHVKPDVAKKFRWVRDQLNAPNIAQADPPRAVAQRIEDRKRLWAEHDELLTRIRETLPGFARFLLPPRLADLQLETAGGAVVLVNAGRNRSDAIIITSDAVPVLVALPDLTSADVHSHTVGLLEATHDGSRLAGRLRKQRVVPEVLSWLWDTVVGPILGALLDTVDARRPLPRVWWLPTGLLGLLPLHAAGHPGHRGALDAVVSSYTPTLRALSHSRSRPPARTRRQLTVALKCTPGLPDLPGTVAEAANLQARHPDAPPLNDDDATTSRVLTAVSDATWAHFACHASADLTAPSRGGLLLYDDTLPISDISRLQLTHAELAYLSACSTAQSGLQHADESIHLASAFHLAGFRHVIASLWPLDDNLAATAAHRFYRGLPATPTADHAATVLHDITLALRADRPDRPDLWAPLIHSGP
ncbi:CHAT domain-containing protein [Streptomyces xantholiticus]